MEIPPSCLLTSPCTLNSAEPFSQTSFPSAVRTNLEWLFSCTHFYVSDPVTMTCKSPLEARHQDFILSTSAAIIS